MNNQEQHSIDGAGEHIVFVFHSSGTVGVERSSVALIRAARRQNARVTIFLPKSGPVLELLRGIDGIEVRYLGAQWWMGWSHTGWRGVLKAVQALAQTAMWWPAIARMRPTAVYVMSTVIPSPMLAARLARVPLVVFLSESIRKNPGLRSALPKSWIIAVVKSMATVTVARSSFAAGQYDGSSLIEPPDISDPQDNADVRPNRNDELRKVVMLGSLSDEKGQQDAVRAVSAARSRGIPLTFDMYGAADLHELAKLNALIESLGSAEFICHRGTTTSPLSVFRSADLSLVCSRNEAYGRVTVESLSVGTPVLGYRAGGTAEILKDGGGITVETSVSALTDALVTLGRNPEAFRSLVKAAGERQQTKLGFGDADRTVNNIRVAIARKLLPVLLPEG